MINEDFEYYFGEHGMPHSGMPVPPADIASLSKGMPTPYRQLLERYGEFTQRDHLFKFIRTDRLQALAGLMFEGDRDLGDGKVRIFCFSLFGQLHFWHPKHALGDVDLLTGNVTCDGLTGDKPPKSDKILDGLFGIPFSLETASYDVFDAKDKPLYKRALKKLGPPGLMDCFGFVPALALGGEALLVNLRKLPAPEHFAILAQADALTLIKTEDHGQTQRVRRIGR